MVVVGIDVGTTKVAAAVIDTALGRILRTAGREHRAGLRGAHAWEHAQDPRVILSVAEQLLGEVAGASRAVEGVCVSGQMHGMLYLDETGSALSPLYTWLDARGALPHPDGGSYAEVLAQRTGHHLAPGFGSVTHFYNLMNDLVPEGTVAVCTILDYVTMRLCGRSRPVSDATTAASLGLFDLDALHFDDAALEQGGFSGIELPEVAPAGTLLGTTSGGVPVFVPVADNQASFLGAVKEPEQSVLVNVGTAGQVSIYSETAVSQTPGIDVRPYPGEGYLHVGAALCSGKAYEHLRSFFREVMRAFGADEDSVDYETMNALAAAASGSGEAADRHLTVDTRFAGTRVDSSISGSITDIGLENFTPENLAAAYIEGIAGELYGFYAAMSSGAGQPIAHLIGSGNGLRANPILRAAVERRFGRTVELPVQLEEAALGAALCAAVGAGVYRDYRSAGSLIAYEG